MAGFAGASARCKKMYVSHRKSLVSSRADWFLPARPSSGADLVRSRVEVPTKRLQAACTKLLSGGGDAGAAAAGDVDGDSRAGARETLGRLEPIFFRGLVWQPSIQLKLLPGRTVRFDFQLVVQPPRLADGRWPNTDPCVEFCVNVEAVQAQGVRARPPGKRGNKAARLSHHTRIEDFWRLGPQAGWDEASWRAKGLVLEGSKVCVDVSLSLPLPE